MTLSVIEVLLVEDDPGDVELILESLEETKMKLKLNFVENGIEALGYLNKEGKYASATRPDLILLDLNMPKMDGREVLAKLKKNESLKSIPVVVLTTSAADEDILKSYGLGCNSYVTKPVGLEQFSKVLQAIENFWFTIVKLPPKNA